MDTPKLKPAEAPGKARMLELLDELRASVESGETLALVAVSVQTEGNFAVQSRGNVSMLQISGFLGRAWMDSVEALRK